MPAISPTHLTELTASGITPEMAIAAGLYTESDPSAVSKLLNWNKPAKSLGPCLVFPYFDQDGKPLGYHRLKPTHPRMEQKKDGSSKPIKYEAPRGVPNRLFIPASTRAVLNTSHDPLIITEGEKKSLCADTNGFPSVSIPGVWAWPARSNSNRKQFIPDLAAVPWKGRKVYVVFDSDAATNPKVQQAESALAGVLRGHGATVRVVRLPAAPDGGKLGLDDYLVRYGAKALKDLLSEAAAQSLPVGPPLMAWDHPARLAEVFLSKHTVKVLRSSAKTWSTNKCR